MSFAIDANTLVCASDQDSVFHPAAVQFLRHCAARTEVFCLAWVTVSAYLRIVTHPSVFRRPLSPEEAMANIDGLLALPQVRVLGEEEDFWDVYREVAKGVSPRGNLVPDAHVAAVLMQHGVRTLYTRDRDFLRFDWLEIVDPLEPAVREGSRRRAGRRRAPRD